MNPTARRTLKALLALVLAGGLAAAAHAATYKFADQGDATSMDPHSLNESLQLSLLGNIYEPLVGRGKKLELLPLLATSWKQTEPTVWRFNLRHNVKFHDGTPFTADDVIFSYERSKADGSDMKTKIATVKEMRKIDDYTVDFVTNDPFPILPDTLNTWFIMSKAWCEKNNATTPVDVRKGKENAATLRANGTGPFMLKSREPGVRTVFVNNPGVLGKGREQRHRGDIHADQERRDPGRRADLGRHRHDGAGAAAGHREAQGRAGAERAAGPRAAHDFSRHGPVARRAAVLEHQGQEPVQGQARAPGVLPGDRYRGDQDPHHARRGDADQSDDRAGHPGLRSGA